MLVSFGTLIMVVLDGSVSLVSFWNESCLSFHVSTLVLWLW